MNSSLFQSKLAPLLEEMIEYKCSIGYSRNTYESGLKNFDRFIGGKFPSEINFTQELVMNWLIKRENESPVSLQGRACLMRVLGKYLQLTGKDAYVLPNKFVSGTRNFTPYIFTDVELEQLFLSIDKVSAAEKILIRCKVFPVLFRIIYTCGLRPNEGRTLLLQNLNTVTGEILITATKQHKERIVIMSDDMKKFVEDYLLMRNSAYPDSPYLFPTVEGNCYTARQVQHFLRKSWSNANQGIEPELLPLIRTYDFRHRFATEVLMRWTEQNENISSLLPYLKTYMGHRSLSSTAYYIHLLPERLTKDNDLDWKIISKLTPEVDLWEN